MKLKRATIFILVQLLVISLIAGSVVYGLENQIDEEENTLTYTYEELLEVAKKNSKELKKRAQEIERSEIMREEARRNKTYTPVGIGSGDQEDVMARAALQGLASANIGMQMAKKQVGIEEDKLAYNVKKTFNKIVLAKNQLQRDESTKVIAQLELDLAYAKYNNGNIGRFELSQAQKAYEEAEKKLETSRISLESAYLELNNITGLAKDLRYNLIAEEVEEKKLSSLEHHIDRVLLNNPSIWTLEQNVRLAELAVSLYSYNAGQEPYKAKELDVSTAKLNVGNAKEALEHSLRTLYHSLEQLKEAREILEINLEKAKESLEMAELKLELGMAVPLEVKKLQNTVAELEHQLLDNNLKYEETLAVYEKPWVAGN